MSHQSPHVTPIVSAMMCVSPIAVGYTGRNTSAIKSEPPFLRFPTLTSVFEVGRLQPGTCPYFHQEVFNEEDLVVTHGSVMSGRF